MKTFLVNFNGYILSGNMLIVEDTIQKAFNKAKKEIANMHLEAENKNFSIDNLKEIDCSQKQCIVINTGDY